MIKVYQQIISSTKGDCFKAAICSLLELDYDKVPNFVEHNDWLSLAIDVFKEQGYKFGEKWLYNPNIRYLENPTDDCFDGPINISKTHSLNGLKLTDGINGLFLASVYSPKYTNLNDHPADHLHSVICNYNFDIVFDPQPEYQNIKFYPYSSLIGYNGIRDIICINKIK